MKITTTLSIIILLCLFVASPHSRSDEPSLSFETFKVDVSSYPKASKLILKTKTAKKFRTTLKREFEQPANFAGHFRLVNLGCGAACAYPAIIDLANGEVSIPGFHTVATLNQGKALDYKLDSRLIKVSGDFNERGTEVGTHFFEWNGSQLKLLKFVAR